MQNNQQNPVMEALNYRHACKRFDRDKPLAASDFEQILEAGRLSPSSFGMEHWRFNVIGPSKREALAEICWNQPQITEAPELIAISTVIADVGPNTAYVRDKFYRLGLTEKDTEMYIEGYNGFISGECKSNDALYAWGAKQCYIALANMMTCGAMLGIDSCPIEGFQRDSLNALLGFNDASSEQVAVLVAFGYRLHEQGERIRAPLDAIVRRIA